MISHCYVTEHFGQNPGYGTSSRCVGSMTQFFALLSQYTETGAELW